MVTMTRDLRPVRAGQDAVVEDDLARDLVAQGAAHKPRPWPNKRDVPQQMYRTKAG